ncbi:hypothetical protein B0F90DRAFT_1889627 [Multifurca ochricompacta]|uniref:DUF8214 domain-containing protein n=1 Tax=Multifurca ochricompacta TaxID=376703 RepID=A0AAD4M8I3_9AGAM|nr:hypothetical protein B0F90DRAFT_1889627 [Multifurca ochricompacta]
MAAQVIKRLLSVPTASQRDTVTRIVSGSIGCNTKNSLPNHRGQIKLKMARLIWLLRGIPDYVTHMFKEYSYWKKQGKRGFIEFEFDRWEQLYAAISFIEDLPIYIDAPFVGMPGTPSYAPPVRSSSPCHYAKFNEVRFMRRESAHSTLLKTTQVVETYMHFTENENRPNLQRALDVAMQCDNLFVISLAALGTWTSGGGTR